MKTMVKTLEQANAILNNAANDPQIMAILTRYGYGFENLQEGMALCETARNSLQTQSHMRLSKVAANQALQKNWKIAQLNYINDLRIARVALKEYSGSGYFLQLNGVRARNFADWHAQAKSFYSGLGDHGDLQALVEVAGLTAERIQQGILFLQQLERDYKQQHVEKSSAVETLAQRNEAIAAFQRWMLTFRTIARAALANHPAALAKLGLEPAVRKSKKKNEALQITMPKFEAAQQVLAAQ